jgi:acetate kinase
MKAPMTQITFSGGGSERGILTMNRGSSSVKFALYPAGDPTRRLLWGKIDRIGLPGTKLTIQTPTTPPEIKELEAISQERAGEVVIDCLERHIDFGTLLAVGHRVVHGGMKHNQPAQVTEALLEDLRFISPFDPEHMPAEIQLIEAFQARHPKLPQIACFDTAFHANMPRVARILPIPRRYDAKGVQRYGFHGLSYSYLMEELARIGGDKVAKGRVILAHLGNGASMAAVRDGIGVDTSMGFTPTAGFPMSTRSGDLDPGLVWYLADQYHLTPKQFHDMVNQESGLMGVSEISPDMRDLFAREKEDVRAAEAVALFCYQVKKWIGSFAAALGGVDTLVFCAGIGENQSVVRARICEGLKFLGIHLDEALNLANADIISKPGCTATVRVIKTDEEKMIARIVSRMMASG